MSVPSQVSDALVFQAEFLPRLAPGRDGDFIIAVKGGYFDLSAERCLREVNRQFVDDVVVISHEQLMLLHPDGHIKVTGRAAPHAHIPLAAEAYLGAVLYAGWNLDRDAALLFFPAFPLALRARLGNDLSLALAPVAYGRVNKTAEEAALDAAHLAAAVAVRTTDRLTAWLGTGTTAGGAQFSAFYFNFLFTPESSFLKGDGYLVLQVGTPLWGAAVGMRHATEKSVKDIAETAEVEALKAAGENAVGINVAKVVVAGALIGVGEHLEGLIYFLELRLRAVITVAVRVVLKGEPAERLLDVGSGGIPRYAKDFIIVSFWCHL